MSPRSLNAFGQKGAQIVTNEQPIGPGWSGMLTLHNIGGIVAYLREFLARPYTRIQVDETFKPLALTGKRLTNVLTPDQAVATHFRHQPNGKAHAQLIVHEQDDLWFCSTTLTSDVYDPTGPRVECPITNPQQVRIKHFHSSGHMSYILLISEERH